MSCKPHLRAFALALGVAAAAGPVLAQSGTNARFLGKTVVTGCATNSDLALDERRGLVYVACFGGNRINVIRQSDIDTQASPVPFSSINLTTRQPSALSLSPDGRFLLVAHYDRQSATGVATANGLTLITLNDQGGTADTRTIALNAAPYGVAFGSDGRALVVTEKDFQLFNPRNFELQVISTFTEAASRTLPLTDVSSLPGTIVGASLSVSGDGTRIAGLTDTFFFTYGVGSGGQLSVFQYTSSPTMGPRVVSMSRDGSLLGRGWVVQDLRSLKVNQWPNPSGNLQRGSHAIDGTRNRIYAQIPVNDAQDCRTERPINCVLQVADADNLRVLARFRLAENLTGKSLLSANSETMYAISESGLTVLPVGDSLDRVSRLTADNEQLAFGNGFCERRPITREVIVQDPAGRQVPFSISTAPGVTVSPAAGVTPRTVRITVDPNSFATRGTSTVTLNLSSNGTANLPAPIRLAINLREPDQRGEIVNVAGSLTDILADPSRNQFFVVRQDTNQVLVFDGANGTQRAALRTGNTPTRMAVTFDNRFLMVGHDNSQYISVFDLDTLQEVAPIIMPGGHYPRSIGVGAGSILVASRVAGPKHLVSEVDFVGRRAYPLSTLGPFENSINPDTALIGSGNGSAILIAQADGNLLVWDSQSRSITGNRKETGSVSGAFAASNFGNFVVGNSLYNASLASPMTMASGTSSGFTFLGETAYRLTSAGANGPGTIEQVNLTDGSSVRPTRTVESPLTTATPSVFTRTLAPLANRQTMAALSASGLTLLPFNYDAGIAPPRIDAVVNAADGRASVAPGGLVTIYGNQLSPLAQGAASLPLPTTLANSCLTVNGLAVPVLYVSPAQINAQLPFQVDGNTTLVLRTPGGVSDTFNLRIASAAPAVFSATIPDVGTQPIIIKYEGGENRDLVTASNPVRPGNTLVIYLTGLGRVSATDLQPGFASPIASVLAAPQVTIGGTGLSVEYAGLVPGTVGLYQINARVPANVPTGLSVPLTITQGTNTTTINIRVVR